MECLCLGTIGLIVAPWKFDVIKTSIFALEASRGFSSGAQVFSSQKPTFPNFNSILECTDISERVLVNSLMLHG